MGEGADVDYHITIRTSARTRSASRSVTAVRCSAVTDRDGHRTGHRAAVAALQDAKIARAASDEWSTAILTQGLLLLPAGGLDATIARSKQPLDPTIRTPRGSSWQSFVRNVWQPSGWAPTLRAVALPGSCFEQRSCETGRESGILDRF